MWGGKHKSFSPVRHSLSGNLVWSCGVWESHLWQVLPLLVLLIVPRYSVPLSVSLHSLGVDVSVTENGVPLTAKDNYNKNRTFRYFWKNNTFGTATYATVVPLYFRISGVAPGPNRFAIWISAVVWSICGNRKCVIHLLCRICIQQLKLNVLMGKRKPPLRHSLVGKTLCLCGVCESHLWQVLPVLVLLIVPLYSCPLVVSLHSFFVVVSVTWNICVGIGTSWLKRVWTLGNSTDQGYSCRHHKLLFLCQDQLYSTKAQSHHWSSYFCSSLRHLNWSKATHENWKKFGRFSIG